MFNRNMTCAKVRHVVVADNVIKAGILLNAMQYLCFQTTNRKYKATTAAFSFLFLILSLFEQPSRTSERGNVICSLATRGQQSHILHAYATFKGQVCWTFTNYVKNMTYFCPQI